MTKVAEAPTQAPRPSEGAPETPADTSAVPRGVDPAMAVINEKLDLLLKAQGISYTRGEAHEGN